MRCDSGNHELTVLKADCPFCKIAVLERRVRDLERCLVNMHAYVEYECEQVGVVPEGKEPSRG